MTRQRTQGEMLKALLKKRGLTQDGLAVLAGTTRETVNKIANDKQPMGDDVAEKIVAALGVSRAEVQLPREEDAASRRTLDHRLRSLEDVLAETVGDLAKANLELSRLRARVRKLEARPWPGEVPRQADGG